MESNMIMSYTTMTLIDVSGLKTSMRIMAMSCCY
jgi:hypothetical protein